uniref:Uncharacterized protein n=1 Tax=Molossus molossus TaxID=27622 RepID=A0A7J8HHU8_MOLMO|nr:hypothetical protein HJG59_011066 [Molossus molossus]
MAALSKLPQSSWPCPSRGDTVKRQPSVDQKAGPHQTPNLPALERPDSGTVQKTQSHLKDPEQSKPFPGDRFSHFLSPPGGYCQRGHHRCLPVTAASEDTRVTHSDTLGVLRV